MPTPYDESILRSLRRITRCIDVYSRRLAQTYQLTGPQLVCLRHLAQNGPLAPSVLAASVSLSQPTITGILDRLEARGLLTRTRLTEDRRRVLVELSPKGWNLAESAPAPLHHSFAGRLAELTESEQAKIDQVLQQVVDMMEASDIDAAPILSAGPIGVDSQEVTEFFSCGSTRRTQNDDE